MTTAPIDWNMPVLYHNPRDQDGWGKRRAIRNATPSEVRESRMSGTDSYVWVNGVGACWVHEPNADYTPALPPLPGA